MGPLERRQWAVLLAVVCLLIGWNYWLDKFFISSPFALFGGGFGDFEVYRLAAASWLSHGNPYVASPAFIYPPTSLPFFALYAPIQFHTAGQLWWITYFMLFLASCVCLCLTMKETDRRLLFVTVTALLFLTSYPLLVLFQLGQVDLLAEAIAIMSLSLQRSRYASASAPTLAVAVLLKGPAVLLLAYFVIFRRDVSYLLRFVVSILVIIGASLFIVPVGDYWYYLTHVVPSFSGVISANSNQSVGGLLSIAHLIYLAPAASLIGFVVFALFAYWAGATHFPIGQGNLSSDSMFLMNVLIMLLFGPRSIIYPYVWVILPLGLFLSAFLMQPVRARYLVVMGFGAFLLNSNLVPSMLNYEVLPLEVVGNIMTTLCLVILFVRPAAVLTSSKALK